jgi:TRAP-type C4-dicarboxylate transport system substrate-binding protein
MRTIGFYLASTALLISAAAGAAETFKIATLAPEGSAWMTDMRAGAKEIEQRTEGRVKFKYYGGGVQGNDKQVLRKMRIGQLHGGAFVSSSLAILQPDAELLGLPLLFDNAAEVRYVRKRMDAKLLQRLEDAGYVNFGFAGTGFAYLMSNKPTSTLQDLDGQKVWIPQGDEISFAALKTLGIAPTLMPLTDVLTGLQTDLIDSVSSPPIGALVLQWHTKLRYITDLPLSYVYAALVIDKKQFTKLSNVDQAVVRAVMEGIYKKSDEASFAENDNAMQALLASGLELVQPDRGQVPRWREIVAKSNRDMAERGVFSVELLDELLGHLQAYRSGTATPPTEDTTP